VGGDDYEDAYRALAHHDDSKELLGCGHVSWPVRAAEAQSSFLNPKQEARNVPMAPPPPPPFKTTAAGLGSGPKIITIIGAPLSLGGRPRLSFGLFFLDEYLVSCPSGCCASPVRPPSSGHSTRSVLASHEDRQWRNERGGGGREPAQLNARRAASSPAECSPRAKQHIYIPELQWASCGNTDA
jgi:hypothetical protein